MTEVQGRVPPHDREAERLVLGGLIIDNSLIPVVGEVISERSFDFAAHREIFSAMLALYERDSPIDLVTLREELTRRQVMEKVGGMAYISGLVADVSYVTNVRHYANIVHEKYLLRSLISACSRVVDKCYEGSEDAIQLIEEAERSLSNVMQSRTRASIVPVAEQVKENLETIEKLATGEKKVPGVPTGFRELDKLILGLHRGDQIIVGARPSVGKTSLCLNVAYHAAKKEEVPVLIFSIEMSKEDVTNRFLSFLAGVSLSKLRSARLSHTEREQLHLAGEELGKLPIFIDDSATLTPLQMRSRAKMLKTESDLGIVMIDYLQLMHYHRRTDNRQQEVTAISRSLKSMARELNVAVVAFSQLSREVTRRRENAIPQLADLRESGSLEQDADVVIFLHDPTRTVHQKEKTYKRPETVEIDLIVAKQRNGPIGTVKLLFQTKCACFKNISHEAPPQWSSLEEDLAMPTWVDEDEELEGLE